MQKNSVLKLKASLYRYTGIYLAYKEECEYLLSDECWKTMHSFAAPQDNDITLKEAQDLAVGLWQTQHGFCRMWIVLRYENPKFLTSPAAWLVVFYFEVKRTLTRYLKGD